jgi:hypothetical protein
MTVMRYSVAVDRLRSVAETCTRLASLWEDDPLVVDAYVFGELLEGAQRPERLQMAFVVDLPPEDVTWYTLPTAMVGFAATVGIDKYPCEWHSRPVLWPVWNHRIRGPVRFWSVAGPDGPTLDALGERRLGDLHRLTPTAAEEAEQLQEELAASLGHLQRVDAAYWEREWRRDHKGLGIYPEDHLWRATHGYLDLLAATRTAGSS